MSDWQKGDLALCVDASPVQDVNGIPECSDIYNLGLKKGAIYTVDKVEIGYYSRVLGLLMVEGLGGLATRFRKIRPSAIKHIEALKDIPVPVRETENA